MKRYIQYEIDGNPVVIEVEDAQAGLKLAGPLKNGIIKAEEDFDKTLEAVEPLTKKLMTKLKDLTSAPDEVGIEFGLKLGFKTGAIIASGSSEAHFKVSLTWKQESAPKPKTQP